MKANSKNLNARYASFLCCWKQTTSTLILLTMQQTRLASLQGQLRQDDRLPFGQAGELFPMICCSDSRWHLTDPSLVGVEQKALQSHVQFISHCHGANSTFVPRRLPPTICSLPGCLTLLIGAGEHLKLICQGPRSELWAKAP